MPKAYLGKIIVRVAGRLVVGERVPFNTIPGHSSWERAIQRCTNPANIFYSLYGGKGITISEEWKSFANFYEDMGARPAGKTLDRIDSNGNYCKENCRWATPAEQARNKTVHVKILYGGRERLLVEVAEEKGISYSALTARIKNGWDIDAAINTPVRATKTGTARKPHKPYKPYKKRGLTPPLK